MVETMASWRQYFPVAWPDANLMINFGALLLAGALGGLLATKVRWLPTITGYMLVGFLAGPSVSGLFSQEVLATSDGLVHIALGLILFKLGTSLHPIRALQNKALVMTSLAESILTFIVVGGLIWASGSSPVIAVLVGAIAVSSSPAVLIHVAHELRAEGPTVEAAKSLVAANNLLSFVLFTAALPLALHGEAFDLSLALAVPLYQLLGALVVGVVVAGLLAVLGRWLKRHDDPVRFALVVGAVVLTLGLAQALKVSMLFASLSLGLSCRWLQRRARLAHVDFGGGGNVFFIILFVMAGAKLHWHELLELAPLAIALVLARSAAKFVAVLGCGLWFGFATRQVVSAGLTLMPMAGMAIGLVQTTSSLAPELGAGLASVVLAAVAIFETLGPPIVAFALRLSGEASSKPELAQDDQGRGQFPA